MKKANTYPVVLVHGFAGYGQEQWLSKLFPYYGLSKKKDAQKYIKSLGFDCCVPSLGPFSSAWDRACELYAQIFGGTVDYGKVHAEKYGHERFGRTYKAMLPQVGKKDKSGNLVKMHLIAHSYGGPTSRVFIEMMTHGNSEEINGTPKKELSPFFAGGLGDLIHSETTLAANHNGISIIGTLGPMRKPIAKIMYSMLIPLGKKKLLAKIYDTRLDQFGKDRTADKIVNNPDDMGFFGLGTKYVERLTKDYEASGKVYYFTYAGCRTHKMLSLQLPNKNMNPLCISSSLMEGLTIKPKWRANDGMVNVISARAPFKEKQEFFEDGMKIEKGIWYKMPVEDKDHISYMGFGEDKDTYLKFFHDILDNVSDLK